MTYKWNRNIEGKKKEWKENNVLFTTGNAIIKVNWIWIIRISQTILKSLAFTINQFHNHDAEVYAP